MKYGLGLYKSSFDERDYLLRGFLKNKGLPSYYDLTGKMTPARSQGKEGSCVGFAMAVGVKEYQEQIDYSRFISLSPRFLYEEAKKISGHKEGTTLKAAIQVSSKLGVCEEHDWPYNPNIPGGPGSGAYENALRYKIKTYARILNLEELKRAISEIGPVIIGVKVYKGMLSEKAMQTGIVPDPGCFERMKVLGGHAVVACGYDDYSTHYKDGHIKFKNSWGTWGDKGYGYLSYRYAEKNMLDAFSSVDIDDPKPYVLRVADLPYKEKGIWV